MLDGGGDVADEEDGAAPYVSWPAFDKALGRLRDIGCPEQIGRTHLDDLYSPTVVNQTMASLRFLGLTDAGDRSTPEMQELLAVRGTPDWPSVLRRVVERAYPRIVGLDLARITAERLQAEFQTYRGRKPAVHRKMELFFLALAREAGIPLSAELAEPRRRVGGDAAISYANALALFEANQAPQHGAYPLVLNRLLAAAPSHAVETPRNALLPLMPEPRGGAYRNAFAALSAVWNPDEMPEDVDAAVVAVLRYLRRKEAEAIKA